MNLHFKFNSATIKRQGFDQYQLEVICKHCKRRGLLWLYGEKKINAHRCPCCGRFSLQTPICLNHRNFLSDKKFILN